jgi:hypothetical protein
MTNHVSISLLGGINGGVEGAEFGGLVNVLNYDLVGGQAAGLFNYTKGAALGAQLAGLANYNESEVTGVQAGGLGNVVTASVEGAQIGGLANYVVGTVTGAQGAGLINMVTDSIVGAQFSGLVNAAPHVQGAQVGYLNHTKTLKGAQVGFLNIADSVDGGVPIGFISFVRAGGYKTFEVGGNEVLYGQASWKTGVNAFYNIFSLGTNFSSDNFIWGAGYGVGTRVPWGKNNAVDLEVMGYQINEGSDITEVLNLLTRTTINLEIGMGENLSVFGGPSFNYYITELYDFENRSWGSDIGFEPHDEGYSWDNDYYWKMWTGFNVGIRF